MKKGEYFFIITLRTEIKKGNIFKKYKTYTTTVDGTVTLIKNMSDLEVRALPQNLPHEIHVSIETLKNFGDHILVKDIALPKDVKATAKPEEIVVSAIEPAKVEEELAKEIEEKVEDVEKVEKPKKETDIVDDEASATKAPEAKK